jgi:hypothetical protein
MSVGIGPLDYKFHSQEDVVVLSLFFNGLF